MPALGYVTRGRVASTIAVAAAAASFVGCSDDQVLLDDSLRPATTTERPTYTDQFTVGTATFTTNLPDGARVFELTKDESKVLFGTEEKAVSIVSWPGHDLSTTSFADLTKPGKGSQKVIDEAVVWFLWTVDCMDFDKSQNKPDTIDSTSALNGQPLTYNRVTDGSEKVGDMTRSGDGYQIRAKDTSAAFFEIKLDTKPCTAVMALATYARNSPDNPLKDFGYRLFVEGDGTVTTTNP